MKQIIHPSKQKSIIVAIAIIVGFFGFQAVSRAIATYEIKSFLVVSFYVYLFLLFLQSFVFDLHLKKTNSLGGMEKSLLEALGSRFEYMFERHHWLEFQNYLILPSVIYWASVSLIFLNPFDELIKQNVILFSSVALGVTFWYLKTVFYASKEADPKIRQPIFLVKFYATFLAIAGSFGICRYFGYSPRFFAILVFCVIFVLLYQAFFQHHFVGFETFKFLIAAAGTVAIIGYIVYIFWNVNFYSGALVMAVIYNTIWGLIHHHYLDRNLTREIVYEYLSVLFLMLVIIFGTTNFRQRLPPPDQNGNQSQQQNAK